MIANARTFQDRAAPPVPSPDVVLRRGVQDLASLRAPRDITVYGCIEAAHVDAGRDLTVHHGICGKGKGSVRVGGCLAARFLSDAHIIARGDVIIEHKIEDSRIECGSELRVDHGTIVAGHAVASVAIHCRTAGSAEGVTTVLELGVSPDRCAAIQRFTAIVVNRIRHAREIRRALETLAPHQITLTAAQKDEVAKRRSGADDLDAYVTRSTQTLQHLKRPLVTALQGAIHITSTVFAGVVIRFPMAQALVTTSLQGPLVITLSAARGRPAIICADPSRGTKTVLPAQPPNA